MKKIIAILALAAGTAFAGDSATVEYDGIKNVGSANGQSQFVLGVKHDINSTFAVDAAIQTVQTENTNALGSRVETGLTAANDFGIVKGYVRTALGQRYTSTGNYTYYSVEPGVSKTFGAFTAKVGYRFRDATQSDVHTTENTGTARFGVSYALSKTDSVGIRYDRVRGDAEQKVTAFNYTRSF